MKHHVVVVNSEITIHKSLMNFFFFFLFFLRIILEIMKALPNEIEVQNVNHTSFLIST